MSFRDDLKLIQNEVMLTKSKKKKKDKNENKDD